METTEAPQTHVPERENTDNKEVRPNSRCGRTLPAINELKRRHATCFIKWLLLT